MPPKKITKARGSKRDDDDSYSYVTDEDEDPESVAAKAAPRAPPSAAAGTASAPEPPRVDGPDVTVTHGAPCATSKAKTRNPSPSSSSEDPGPELPRQSRSPILPRLSRSPVRTNPGPEAMARGRSLAPERNSPSPVRVADKAGPYWETPATRGKGKHRGHAPRRTKDCPHCWQPIAVTSRGSGLSQHMWWNLDCIAHQIYAQGDTTWSRAIHQAQAVKDRRETEWDWQDWNEPAPADPLATPVVPARSAHHRFLLLGRIGWGRP